MTECILVDYLLLIKYHFIMELIQCNISNVTLLFLTATGLIYTFISYLNSYQDIFSYEYYIFINLCFIFVLEVQSQFFFQNTDHGLFLFCWYILSMIIYTDITQLFHQEVTTFKLLPLSFSQIGLGIEERPLKHSRQAFYH